MIKQLRRMLLAILLTGLYSCGMKGPLYYPLPNPIIKKITF